MNVNYSGFEEVTQYDLEAVNGGGFWSDVAYYAFVTGVGALGAAAGTALAGPVGTQLGARLGARVGSVVGGMAGAYVGDLVWDVTR